MWAIHHTQSEQYANLAQTSLQQGDVDRAMTYYRQAAEQETAALKTLDPAKKRTYGVTAVSAASLWYKAKAFQQAQQVACYGLATDGLPAFAVKALQELLEESCQKAGVTFSEGEVLVSVIS